MDPNNTQRTYRSKIVHREGMDPHYTKKVWTHIVHREGMDPHNTQKSYGTTKYTEKDAMLAENILYFLHVLYTACTLSCIFLMKTNHHGSYCNVSC